MNKFVARMLELGAELDKAVSQIEISMVINDADILYRNHIEQLTIHGVVKPFVRFNGLKTKCFDPSKKYKVLDDKEEHYLITDDENDVIWVFKKNFTLITK